MGKHTVFIEQQIINEEILDFNEPFIMRAIEERKLMPYRTQSTFMFNTIFSNFQNLQQNRQYSQPVHASYDQKIKKLIILYRKFVQKQYFDSLYCMILLQSIFFFTFFLSSYTTMSYWIGVCCIIYKVELMQRYIAASHFQFYSCQKEQQYQELYQSVSLEDLEQAQTYEEFIMKNGQILNQIQGCSFFLGSEVFNFIMKYLVKLMQKNKTENDQQDHQKIQKLFIVSFSFLDSCIFFLIIIIMILVQNISMIH